MTDTKITTAVRMAETALRQFDKRLDQENIRHETRRREILKERGSYLIGLDDDLLRKLVALEIITKEDAHEPSFHGDAI